MISSAEQTFHGSACHHQERRTSRFPPRQPTRWPGRTIQSDFLSTNHISPRILRRPFDKRDARFHHQYLWQRGDQKIHICQCTWAEKRTVQTAWHVGGSGYFGHFQWELFGQGCCTWYGCVLGYPSIITGDMPSYTFLIYHSFLYAWLRYRLHNYNRSAGICAELMNEVSACTKHAAGTIGKRVILLQIATITTHNQPCSSFVPSLLTIFQTVEYSTNQNIRKH